MGIFMLHSPKEFILENNILNIVLYFIILLCSFFCNFSYASICGPCERPIINNCTCQNGTIEASDGYCRSDFNGVTMGKGNPLDYDGDCIEDSNSTLDCDPNNPAIGPNVLEICDGIDNNCDGQIDEGININLYVDNDNDGFGDEYNYIDNTCYQIDGYSSRIGDCNDNESTINPDAIEICGDQIDNNCNNLVDDSSEGCTAVCGDGILDTAEGCDDGNVANGDGCSSTCTVELTITECPCFDEVVLNNLRQSVQTSVTPQGNICDSMEQMDEELINGGYYISYMAGISDYEPSLNDPAYCEHVDAFSVNIVVSKESPGITDSQNLCYVRKIDLYFTLQELSSIAEAEYCQQFLIDTLTSWGVQ